MENINRQKSEVGSPKSGNRYSVFGVQYAKTGVKYSIMSYFIFAAILLCITSCEQTIEVDLGDYESKLVVHCILQPDSVPNLYLTESTTYFTYIEDTNKYNFVKDAMVIISYGNSDDTLQQKAEMEYGDYQSYDWKKDSSYIFRPSADVIVYRGNIKIESGKTYELKIKYGDKDISTSTYVPYPVSIDSVTLDTVTSYGYTQMVMKAHFKDFSGTSDFYSIETGTLKRLYTYDDSVYTPIDSIDYYYQTSNNNFTSDESNDGGVLILEQYPYCDYNTFQDSALFDVFIKNANKETGKFFNSMYDQEWSSNDPFTEPTTIKSNIEGGIGIFGAWAVSPKISKKIKCYW